MDLQNKVDNESNNESNNELTGKKVNTDPKPYICYLNSDLETMMELFLKKIKPMEGIVKHKMVNWNDFPKDLENAKLIGKKWVNKFHSSDLYNNYRISIYFHLEKKTIRFELKSKNLNLIVLDSIDNIEEKILSYEYIVDSRVFFNCEQTNYFDEFDLEKCKNTGKRLSDELEKKNTQSKFIVFLNFNKKTVQITMKHQ